MQNLKDVLVWEYARDRRLAQFVVRLKNVKGAFAICSQALAEYNINLLSGFHTAPSSSKIAAWSFFADVTESIIRPDVIGERLKSLPFVESVEVYASREGLLVDDKNFPLRISGHRAMVLTTRTLTEMLSRLWNVFGTGAVTIIHEMGESMGRFRAQSFVEEFGNDFVIENLTELLKTYTATGFAELDIENYDPKRGALSLVAKELFECSEGQTPGRVKSSVFFKGHLNGFISEVFNAAFDVTESECVSSGASACRFVVSRIEVPSQRIPVMRKGKLS